MAVGYGLEKDNTLSYWRTDTLGQPSLAEPHRTYLVSGQGDGAMIEVLRLRISQYRQDRILDELIVPRPRFYKAVKALQKNHPEPAHDMFAAFESLEQDEPNEFAEVREELIRRLRRDTDVILHLYKHRFAELFDDKTLKDLVPEPAADLSALQVRRLCPGRSQTSTKSLRCMAFQLNRSSDAMAPRRIRICRISLSTTLHEQVKKHFGDGSLKPQGQSVQWSGGYFGFPGSLDAAKTLEDDVRQELAQGISAGAYSFGSAVALYCDRGAAAQGS